MHIIEYKDRIESLGLSPKSVKNHLDHLHAFFSWVKSDREMIDVVPSFPVVSVPESSFSWLAQEEQIKIFETVPDADRPIIAFLMLQGCRPGEARALKCKDVNLQAGTITVSRTWSRKVLRERRKGRGAKPYVFPIHEELFDHIADRVNGSLPEAWLFPNPRTGRHYTEPGLKKLWHRIREKAELAKSIRLYDATRHSFASNLINKGDSLFMVSQLLGHSDTRTTEKYSHASIQGKRTTLEKLSLKKVFSLGSDRAVEEKSQKNYKLNQMVGSHYHGFESRRPRHLEESPL